MTKTIQETIFRVLLFLTGVINFLPSLLAIIPGKIGESYGVAVGDVNLELLLRHRAVLFGIIGGLIIYSALVKKHYSISMLIGFISMTSFLLLYSTIGGINEALEKVMHIDIIGLVLLFCAYTMNRFKKYQ